MMAELESRMKTRSRNQRAGLWQRTLILATCFASTHAMVAHATITTNEIFNHTNIVKDANSVPPSVDYAVYYDCANVKFNERVSDKLIVLCFVKKLTATTTATWVTGGLTIFPNSDRVSTGHFNYAVTTVGMKPGDIATNGLNGGSFWVVLRDENQNGKVGTYRYDSVAGTGLITAEPGEFVGTNEVNCVFTGMPAFPASGTGPVSITSIRISGYEDNDRDGIPDSWQFQYPTTNGYVGGPAGSDYDHDGLTDKQEWIAGTNPTNAASVWRTGLALSNAVAWPSLQGRLYSVSGTTNLAPSSWSPVPGATNLPGTGTNMTWQIATATNSASFYKVDVRLSPDEVVNP